MKIGIASPALVRPFEKYLNNILPDDLDLGIEGSTSVNNLALGLLELGHEVSIYTIDYRVNTIKIFSGNNLKIYVGKRRNYKCFRKIRKLDFFRYEANVIRKIIELDKPDIVSAHWSYYFAVGTIWSKRPHLITFRDHSLSILLKKNILNHNRMIRHFLDIYVRKKGEHFCVNSLYLQKKMNTFKENLPIIPNAINPDIKIGVPKKINKNNKIKIISILTGWGNIKNPKPALLAFDKLQKVTTDIDFEYHFFGPGYELNSKGYKWAQKKGLLKNVYFRGSLKHNDLMKKLGQYDILIHPATEESFGNILIEAMSQGVPIIAGKDSGAVPWVLGYGKYGELVDVTNSKNIADGILNLVNNAEYYNNLSKKGFENIHLNFTAKKVAEKYVKLFDDILGDGLNKN